MRIAVVDMLSLLLLSLPVRDDIDLLDGGLREQLVLFHYQKIRSSSNGSVPRARAYLRWGQSRLFKLSVAARPPTFPLFHAALRIV